MPNNTTIALVTLEKFPVGQVGDSNGAYSPKGDLKVAKQRWFRVPTINGRET